MRNRTKTDKKTFSKAIKSFNSTILELWQCLIPVSDSSILCKSCNVLVPQFVHVHLYMKFHLNFSECDMNIKTALKYLPKNTINTLGYIRVNWGTKKLPELLNFWRASIAFSNTWRKSTFWPYVQISQKSQYSHTGPDFQKSRDLT